MSQLSLYLDEPAMATLREDAKQAGTTLSKYVAALICEAQSRPAWPTGFFDLYGCLDEGDIAEPEDLSWESNHCPYDDFAVR